MLEKVICRQRDLNFYIEEGCWNISVIDNIGKFQVKRKGKWDLIR